MANVCSNSMTITGSRPKLKDLYDRIHMADETLIKKYFFLDSSNYYGISSISLEETYLYIEFDTKWSPPDDEIESLSKEYHTLTFCNRYEESGMEIYGEDSIKNGEYTERISYTPLQWYEDNDTDFIHEKNKLDEMEYDEFLKTYSLEYFEEYPYTMLEIYIVSRIKDKDLPLFMAVDWADTVAKNNFKKRLQGVTN